MRLRTIKKTLENNIVHLNFKREYLSGNQPGFLYTDITNLKMAIGRIKKLGLYEALISQIETSVIFSTSQDEIILTDSKEDIRLKKGLEVVSSGCSALLMILEDLFKEKEDESTIYIRMPKIKDLEDLAKKSKQLHTAISQSVLDPSIKGTIRVRSYDIGSLWIAISVGSLAAVKLIGGIVWAAAVIRRKKVDFKNLEQNIKCLKIKSASMDDLRDAQKKQLETSLKEEARNLGEQFYKGKDSEKVERIRYSIKLICDLMEKGVQIHPALDAPSDVGGLFPDYKNIALIESRVQELGSGA